MMENMSSRQFFKWLEYFNEEPWGFEIDNYRYGIIASSILNSVRGERTDKVWTPDDFFNFDNISRVTKYSDKNNLTNMKMISNAFNNKNKK